VHLFLLSVAAAQAFAATPSFTTLAPATPPGERRSTGGALKPGATSDEFVGFGGFAAGGTVTEVIRYRTQTNEWASAAATLPGRERHGLAYDPVHDVFVLAGGANGLTLYDAVFLINGNTLAQSAPTSPATRPSARIDPLLQWIPALGKFLYFGGRTSVFANQHVGDQWTLDVSDGGVTWASLGGAVPSARGAVCSGFDPASGRLYLFGGEGTSALADTWSFSADAGWAQLTVTGTVPSARSFAACAWDPTIQQLVLYGGQTSTQVGGLFTFNPATNTWTSWTVTTTTPGNLSDSAAAFSPALGGILLFGGQTASATYSRETWLLQFANTPPQVDAGANFSVGENARTTLSGSVFDLDGDATTVSWVQTGGPVVVLSDRNALQPMFVTPMVSAPTQLRFLLSASDGVAMAAPDDVNVTVLNSINLKPLADAGPDQMVLETVLVTLAGSGVDPDGDPITGFSWVQTGGPAVTLSAPSSATTTFTAPVVGVSTSLKFELTVTDGTITSDVDEVAVNVSPPVIDAGIPDAGISDAGAADAGAPDAGVEDAGVEDAGVEDAGLTSDAGVPDAGLEEPDAGGPTMPRQASVGCGCAGAPFSALWFFAAISWALRIRRRQLP
jgi:hypothetical protein